LSPLIYIAILSNALVCGLQQHGSFADHGKLHASSVKVTAPEQKAKPQQS
jgi:hypothetical protein